MFAEPQNSLFASPFIFWPEIPMPFFSQLLDCECYADKHYIENTANSAQLKLLSALITFDSLMEPYCILHVLSPQLYLLWVSEVWGMSEYRDIELITIYKKMPKLTLYLFIIQLSGFP